MSRIDPDKIRSSGGEMRAAVQEVASAGEATWTGPIDGLVTALQDVARVDLCLARLVEGHADAMRILDQAGTGPLPGVYGVWASRSAGTGLRARSHGGSWALSGRLRFASGIDLIDRALAPGWTGDDHHLLFDLPIAGLEADRDSWPVTAMDAARSFTLSVDVEVPRPPIGAVDFYLARPGFVIGGLGPAAVWAGGARRVWELVADGLRSFDPSPHQLLRLGAMEQAVWTAEGALLRASTAGELPPVELAAEASRIRTAAVIASDVVLAEAPLIVGPAGLSSGRALSRTLADLGMYVRQHHLDLELARLGASGLARRGEPGR